MQGARVWSLVGELRLCTLCSAIKREKIRCEWGQGLGIKYGFLMRQWRTNIRNWFVPVIKKRWNRPSLMVQWIRIHRQCGRRGFDPWSRKIPCALEQQNSPKLLGLRSRAWEPQLRKPVRPQPVLPRTQATAMGAWAPQWRPSTAKHEEWNKAIVATQMGPEVVVLRESDGQVLWYHSCGI